MALWLAGIRATTCCPGAGTDGRLDEEVHGRDRAVDSPGFGEQPLVLGEVRQRDHARDAEALLREVGDEQVVGVGSRAAEEELGVASRYVRKVMSDATMRTTANMFVNWVASSEATERRPACGRAFGPTLWRRSRASVRVSPRGDEPRRS